MSKSLLHTAKFPDDLKTFDLNQLNQLADEIRTELLKIGDKCGGHLASNLGVVELTIVMHTLFESPTDKFLWDTSHQTYVHKMLTGRLDKMYTIRQDHGLSGFAKIKESEHDCFGAGHASTSLSAALGFAHARDIQKQDHHVLAVVGDSGLSGGMAFEALNNTQHLKSNFICVLNDNDMSISHPVGMMSEYMTNVRTSKVYNDVKERFEAIIENIPHIGSPLYDRIEKFVERVRGTILNVKMGVLFEEFGFRYMGPIDGHNIPLLMAALKYAKSYPGPILIHISTKKGKGYNPAENDPVKYHGVSPKKTNATKASEINESQQTVATHPDASKSFSQIFGEEMITLAKSEKNMAVITPAMIGGSGLTEFAKQFPDQLFDVGIAEEHAVTFAAGMSKGGTLPILAIYSTFLQRGYDQVIHDVCLQELPMVFAIDRAGIVGADGATHHGVFDYNYLLPIPNIVILAPKDTVECRQMLRWSQIQ